MARVAGWLAGAGALAALALGAAGTQPGKLPGWVPAEAPPAAVPDFPAALRRTQPVEDIRQAAVYTVEEPLDSDYGLAAARKVGSDVIVRGWFKWRQAPDWGRLAHLVPQVHALGALFGGGVTCSALYDGENGLTEAQGLDLATRGPDGRLVDAWGRPGVRHGTLSNPAYLEYILSWCRRQIDAGADYLFMDEINAALGDQEGFDDYSLRDFRDFLVRLYVAGKGWTRNDPQWHSRFQVNLADAAVCPDGTIATFDYRAYLQKGGHVAKPHAAQNPLAGEWHAFRRDRDDRAWKSLADAIRAYAGAKGRRVVLSANGLARYVDLQVLGVWGLWRVRDGAVDLSERQLDDWAATVRAGWALAGRQVPVVFFHDWGMDGFPWMRIAPGQRELWMRVRGAEIYAAGGFFAFPIRGPYGNDAVRDGTIREVARQTAFYQEHKALYLDGRLLGFEPLQTEEPHLSLALWACEKPPALILHVINRQAQEGRPARRTSVSVQIPAAAAPKAVRIVSPDWPGERRGEARTDGRTLTVTIPELEAYAVAVLDYDALPSVPLAAPRIVPQGQWARPTRSEFPAAKDGTVGDAWALVAFLQGRLHEDLSNPPTFLVHLPEGGSLRMHVRAVATLGARVECLVDGNLVKTVDLPDLDGKNDSGAREYDKTYEFPIPAGRHRVALRNVGGDWAYVTWYDFVGRLADWGG